MALATGGTRAPALQGADLSGAGPQGAGVSGAGAGAGATRPLALGWLAAVGLPGVILAPGSVLLLAGLLLAVPALALLPLRPARGATLRAVLLLGLAASLHPLHRLWQEDQSWTTAIALLRHTDSAPLAWTAAAAGVVLAEIVSVALHLRGEVLAARERRHLLERVALLEEEWGPMPAMMPLPPL